jgi:hypothetical protein
MAEFVDFLFEKVCELLGNPVIEPAKYSWSNDGFVAEFLFIDMHDLLGFS